MTQELGDAYTLLERDDELRCGVLHAVGPHTTAGLDIPAMAPHRAKGATLYGEGNIDCFGLTGLVRQEVEEGRDRVKGLGEKSRRIRLAHSLGQGGQLQLQGAAGGAIEDVRRAGLPQGVFQQGAFADPPASVYNEQL